MSAEISEKAQPGEAVSPRSDGVRPGRIGPPLAVFALALAALLSAFLPLWRVGGLAVGGVLETGLLAPVRWAPGLAVGAAAYLALSRGWARPVRLWWATILAAALGSALFLFIMGASGPGPSAAAGQVPLVVTAAGRDSGSGSRSGSGSGAASPVGLLTGLPLVWREAGGVAGQLDPAGRGAGFLAASRHVFRPLDRADAASLHGVSRLLIAQPRLLQPAELVALDAWVRAGGRGVFLVDPLLLWPSALPPGDPRRAPLTSLLDPLLAHWGLRLEPVAPGRVGPERRRLESGPVLVLAGASRFVSVPPVGEGAAARCALAEGGLVARCRVGRGQVALIADADLIDDALWLADAAHPERADSRASDVVRLIDEGLDAPLAVAVPTAGEGAPTPRRIADDASLTGGLRHALLALLFWVGLGGAGQEAVRRRFRPGGMGSLPERMANGRGGRAHEPGDSP